MILTNAFLCVAVQSKFAFFHQNCVNYFCTFTERKINEIVYKTDIDDSVFGKSKKMALVPNFCSMSSSENP